MEALITWFTKNHVAANFLMAFVVVLGITTWPTLKSEIFPETSMDAFVVSVPFPNATPEEVEKGVVVPIEEAIQDLDGIKRIRSTASPSVGSVSVEAEVGYAVRDLMDNAKTRIDAIQNFSEEAEEPIIEELIIKNKVLSIALSAQTDEKTLVDLTEQVREALLVYDKGPSRITQATVAGARDYEISIEVSENTLRQYGLTFDQVAAAVRRSSLDLPGGSVRTPGGEILIRTEKRRYTAPEFEEITVVTRPDGSSVKLGEIARVIDGFEDVDLSNRFDKRPAMLINVYRVGNEDTLKVADAAKKFVNEEAPRILPDGVELKVWQDDSTYLSGRMNLLAKNGIAGLLLVALVLTLFLRPSLAVLVALGIPVSFAGAIAMMPYTGISINMISLFAFILVLGIVVDDAIVVGENVYRRIRNGEDPKIAAPKGTHEVGIVVIFGVITTMVAFTPMLGLSGFSGKIWPNIPLIVIPTLMFSILQSKFILPAHLSYLRPHDPERRIGPILRFQQKFANGLETIIERFYRPVLKLCLNNRYVVLSVFLAIFIITIMTVASGWIKFTFFPNVEADVVSAKLEMPTGVPFETTSEAVAQIELAAERIKEEYTDREGRPVVKHMLASVGFQPFQTGTNTEDFPAAAHLGEVTMELQPAKDRDITGDEIASIWRSYTGSIPGAVDLAFQTVVAGGGNAIDLELSGDNLDSLELAAAEVKDALADFKGVIDIASSNREGNRELKLDISPSAEALGLRLDDVARQARQGFYGDEVQRLQRGRDEVRVFVRYPEDERESITNLLQMKVRGPDGAEIPFGEVATAEWGRSYDSIQRSGRRRAVRITADIDQASDANSNEVVAAITAPDGVLSTLGQKYPGITYSFEGEQKDQNDSIQEMKQKALLALLIMYVLMAIPLKSYFQPMIVMSVIPFGLVGAVFGHLLMGFNFSIMSMCGIVALAGVVVNDSLVLVDYVNRYRASGHTLVEAAWEAGAARFRPILLTSMTTFAGLTPMLLETDIQARFLIPMAVSLAFGILFATFITLILIPSVYLIQNDFSNLFRRLFGKRVEH